MMYSVENNYSTPRAQKVSHLKTQATNFSEQQEQRHYFGSKLFEDVSPLMKKSSIENDSILSFNRPDINQGDAEELLKLMKVVNFLSTQIRSKKELINLKVRAIEKLKEERQCIEHQINLKNKKFDRNKIVLRRKKKQQADNREEMRLFLNKQINQLKNKIFKIKSSSKRCKTDYSMRDYLNQSELSSVHPKQKEHKQRRLYSEKSQRESSFQSRKQSKNTYVSVMPPYLGYQYSPYQPFYPYHPPYNYAHMSPKPTHRPQNSTNLTYLNSQSSEQSQCIPIQSPPNLLIENKRKSSDFPSQFSFNNIPQFNNKLSNEISKKNSGQTNMEDSEVNIHGSKKQSFPPKYSKNAGGRSSEQPTKKTNKMIHIESNVNDNELLNLAQKTKKGIAYKITKSNLNESSGGKSSPQKKIEESRFRHSYQHSNSSSVNVSIPSSVDKDSFDRKPQVKRSQQSPSSSKKRLNKSIRDQSAIVLESKYLEDIKSLSGYSQDEVVSPTLRVFNVSQMGASVEVPRNLEQMHNRKNKENNKFQSLLPLLKEPQCESQYEATPRAKHKSEKSSSQEQDYNFRTLEDISQRDRSKLMAPQQEEEEDDILSNIYLSTESRYSRQKNRSKTCLTQSRRDEIHNSKYHTKDNIQKSEVRCPNTPSSEQEPQGQSTKIRITMPNLVVKVPPKPSYSSIEQANQEEEDTHSSIKKKSSRKIPPPPTNLQFLTP